MVNFASLLVLISYVGGPSDVTVSANNHLLVADQRNSCIHTYTLDGHYVGKFGTPGSGMGQLNKV